MCGRLMNVGRLVGRNIRWLRSYRVKKVSYLQHTRHFPVLFGSCFTSMGLKRFRGNAERVRNSWGQEKWTDGNFLFLEAVESISWS